MSEEDDQLSEDELNSLISDLESRSEGGGGGGSADLEAGGPEDQDIEELMKEVDQERGEASAEPKVAEPEVEAGPDLSDLDVADELPAETDGSAPEPASSDGGQKEAAEGASSGQSAGTEKEGPPAKASADEATGGKDDEPSKVWPWVWAAAKWTGYALPVVAFWWILGAYLGQWISAGWLIAVVATMFVAGIPKLLYDLSDRRGKFRWWLSGASLVFTIALVAPMTDAAAGVLVNYGHWPATTVSEITGSPAGLLVDTNAAVGESIGRALDPGLPADESARSLGQ